MKRENKILFGIIAVFLLLLFCFIGLAKMIFEGLERISKAAQPTIEESPSKLTPLSEFKEIHEQFERLDEVIEENKKLLNEEFKQAVEGFQQGFETVQENFHHNDLGKKTNQKESHQ